MAEPKNGALIGQPAVPAKAGKLTKQGHVVQALFHRRIAQGEPLLHEVNAQHGLQRKGRAALLAFGSIGRNQLDQCRPRHYALHLREELTLAHALGCQIQARSACFMFHILPARHDQTSPRRTDLCRPSLGPRSPTRSFSKTKENGAIQAYASRRSAVLTVKMEDSNETQMRSK